MYRLWGAPPLHPLVFFFESVSDKKTPGRRGSRVPGARDTHGTHDMGAHTGARGTGGRTDHSEEPHKYMYHPKPVTAGVLGSVQYPSSELPSSQFRVPLSPVECFYFLTLARGRKHKCEIRILPAPSCHLRILDYLSQSRPSSTGQKATETTPCPLGEIDLTCEVRGALN